MMKKRTTYQLLMLLFIGLAFNACIEPFEIENTVFESALVVEATITDEEKQQAVTLSRAYSLGEEGPRPESNALVLVIENDQTQYTFNENELGRYVSDQNFAAKAGASYVLSITTADGRKYTSTPETAPEKVPISKVYAERETNDLGEEGVSILLDNEAPAGEPKYFRYEYEETYKIVAPEWTPLEYDIINDDLTNMDFYEPGRGIFFHVGLKDEEESRQTCYKTVASIDIKQVSTASLNENAISRFSIRFLNRENYVISHRYSILVKQYTQTPEAFFYFQKLDDFASSESVFTDIQAGFFEGNVHSDTNQEEKVIGFFEVASIDSERLYFNYADLFPGEVLPNYPVTCEVELDIPLYSPGYHAGFNGPNGEWVCDSACFSPLINAIRQGSIAYYKTKPGYEGFQVSELTAIAPFLSKVKGCIDCRVLGSNIKPNFWEDD